MFDDPYHPRLVIKKSLKKPEAPYRRKLSPERERLLERLRLAELKRILRERGEI